MRGGSFGSRNRWGARGLRLVDHPVSRVAAGVYRAWHIGAKAAVRDLNGVGRRHQNLAPAKTARELELGACDGIQGFAGLALAAPLRVEVGFRFSGSVWGCGSFACWVLLGNPPWAQAIHRGNLARKAGRGLRGPYVLTYGRPESLANLSTYIHMIHIMYLYTCICTCMHIYIHMHTHICTDNTASRRVLCLRNFGQESQC